jgi:hypothetical protein
MRIAIFVAVVVVHIALVWYLLALRHVRLSEEEDQSSMTLIYLAPSEPEKSGGRVDQDAWAPPMLYGGSQGSVNAQGLPMRAAPVPHPTVPAEALESAEPAVTESPGAEPTGTQSTDTEAPNTSPAQSIAKAPINWHDEAAIVAQADAQHIIESEDRTARQAGALTAMIKPLPGPYVPGPAFHWDPNPRYHWAHVPGGGYKFALNDHCDVFFFIMVFVGCSVGELPPARDDLFKNMHPPVKFGDWDWRLDDP